MVNMFGLNFLVRNDLSTFKLTHYRKKGHIDMGTDIK
jgi:hypothetical protein